MDVLQEAEEANCSANIDAVTVTVTVTTVVVVVGAEVEDLLDGVKVAEGGRNPRVVYPQRAV